MKLEGPTSFPVKNKGKSKQIQGRLLSQQLELSPVQLIYTGKCEHRHPQRIKFLPEFGVTHSENHYRNEIIVHHVLPEVIIPYAKQQRVELR